MYRNNMECSGVVRKHLMRCLKEAFNALHLKHLKEAFNALKFMIKVTTQGNFQTSVQNCC